MRNAPTRSSPRPETPRLELVLSLADGSPWRLTVSPGIEAFIGNYPRLEGIDCGEPLLRFRVAGRA
ncbi:MAG TPA: hypothetical protein VF759_08800 [Allosphingosinicella sp.]|jgi:hypothetical protein